MKLLLLLGNGMAFTEERLAIDDGLLLPLLRLFGSYIWRPFGHGEWGLPLLVFLFPMAQNCLRKDVRTAQVYR
jgi:hypothetical protein